MPLTSEHRIPWWIDTVHLGHAPGDLQQDHDAIGLEAGMQRDGVGVGEEQH